MKTSKNMSKLCSLFFVCAAFCLAFLTYVIFMVYLNNNFGGNMMDYPILVFCPECNKQFPITEQNKWTGLCPACQSKATVTYLEAHQYLNETGKDRL